MRQALFTAAALMVCATNMRAASPHLLPSDAGLQRIVETAVANTLSATSNLVVTNQVAVTLVDLTKPDTLRAASFRGGAVTYPASVVKLFFLAAAHQWLADGKLADTAELRRAMQDMTVDSSNDATHYVVDALTGTTGGPELPEAEMKQWGEKRNAVNRYFASLGYTNINANQKPWCEGPYGRERVWVGKNYTNRNALTTDATARLLTDIALGRCVSRQASADMLKLLARDRTAKLSDPDSQAQGFTAKGLPADAKLWSKAGWTSSTRHDAAYVELADGRRFILVTFTTGHARNRDLIGLITRSIVSSRW